MALATTLGLTTATLPTAAATDYAGDAVGAPVITMAPAGEEKATRAAILPLVVTGDPMPEADQDQLTGRLVEGLRRGDFEVVSPEDVVGKSPGAATCQDAGCYASIASSTGATHLVRAVVDVEDRDYRVEVLLVDGTDGSQVATSEDSCQICGVSEVGDLLDTAAATLRTKLDTLAQGPATLVVSSTPPGAEVSIDGELKGTTPFEEPVLAGKHVLRISLEGYITVEREVTFVEGIEDKQAFELEKVPSRLPPRPWGWVSLGLGVAAIGASAAFTVLDDRNYEVGGACDTPDAQGDCPRLWDTDWIVFSTALVGGALTTLGVAILINSATRKKDRSEGELEVGGSATARRKMRRKRLRFGVGPGSVSVQGRF